MNIQYRKRRQFLKCPVWIFLAGPIISVIKGQLKTKKYQTSLSLLLLLLFSLVIYSNTLNNTFVYDDDLTIENSLLIRSWKNLPSLFDSKYFHFSGETTYRPVVTLSYLIDRSLWKLKPAGYHLTNLFLHTANGILLYFFIRLLLKKPFPAFVAALLFVAHPVNAETVNCVSFREDLLAFGFVLLAFIAYLKIVALVPGKNIYFVLCPVFFLLALFSKEMAMTLPLLFLLRELCFGEHLKKLLKKNLPLYSILLAALIFYLLVRFVFLKNPREPVFSCAPLYLRTAAIGALVFFYLKLLLFPAGLSAEYIFPLDRPVSEPEVFLPLAVLAAVFFFSVVNRHRFPVIIFGVLWFLVSLAPVLNVFPLYNPAAERYLYLPAAGFCLTAAYLFTGAHARTNKPLKFLPSALLIILLCLYSFRTFTRNRDWKDSFTLCRRTLKSCPGSARFHNNLGNIYKKKGLFDDAIGEYHLALKLDTDYSLAHYNLGVVYEALEMPEKAISEYKAALAIYPDYVFSHNNLGVIYREMGLLDKAVEEFRETLRIEPYFYKASYNLGVVYEEKGILDEAVAQYQASIRVNPDFVSAHNNLGVTYRKKGMTKEAIGKFKDALKVDPKYAGAHYNLALAYKEQGLLDDAVGKFRSALALAPDNYRVHYQLGLIYENRNLPDKAAAEYRAVLKIKPDFAGAQTRLEKLTKEPKKQ